MSYIIKMALDIKARFEPPAPMTSPLEAYCAIGTIARAMKLGLPERKDTLFEMRDQLDADMGNSERSSAASDVYKRQGSGQWPCRTGICP